MVRRAQGSDKFLTEAVLSNVRVLAIDQQIQEKDDGSKAVVGTTATLELTPDQTKVLTVAQQMADKLSLALAFRSRRAGAGYECRRLSPERRQWKRAGSGHQVRFDRHRQQCAKGRVRGN